MNVIYHPDVQKDVSRILRHYDKIDPRLGDEFWAELNSFIAKAWRFHFESPGRRRANLHRFPYHFLFREVAGGIRITVVRGHKQHPQHRPERR